MPRTIGTLTSPRPTSASKCFDKTRVNTLPEAHITRPDEDPLPRRFHPLNPATHNVLFNPSRKCFYILNGNSSVSTSNLLSSTSIGEELDNKLPFVTSHGEPEVNPENEGTRRLTCKRARERNNEKKESVLTRIQPVKTSKKTKIEKEMPKGRILMCVPIERQVHFINLVPHPTNLVCVCVMGMMS
ncbi:hypothetical protein AVEN_34937-1 [Araneus ventricosus]|uniref:Uncharacterized protein n=1 Tax=Araneus ventricosus TaxID=182803 RepID=A0A4Y2G802_ARAVE|nr:hypothetical protein AVEN_34937-1 [Araneus ventricosus]